MFVLTTDNEIDSEWKQQWLCIYAYEEILKPTIQCLIDASKAFKIINDEILLWELFGSEFI